MKDKNRHQPPSDKFSKVHFTVLYIQFCSESEQAKSAASAKSVRTNQPLISSFRGADVNPRIVIHLPEL
jgi:hypothetical protein